VVTIGSEQLGIRCTRGRIDRNGCWHPNQLCIFILFKNKRFL
jgi:hypothetical protein